MVCFAGHDLNANIDTMIYKHCACAIYHLYLLDSAFHTIKSNTDKIGFKGRMNDNQTFALCPKIGPGLDLDFPPNCYLLGDTLYPSKYPLFIPYNRRQIRIANRVRQQNMTRLNSRINSFRSFRG